MFENISGKIKSLATVLSVVGICISCVVGFVTLVGGGDGAAIGLVIAAIGSLCSWVSGFFIYGFGELIESNQSIAKSSKVIADGIKRLAISTKQIKDDMTKSASDVGAEDPAPSYDRDAALDDWHDRGLITDEDYDREKSRTDGEENA